MTHEELKALLPLKALDRLDSAEGRDLDAHLAEGCDECERELASFREALAALALATVEDREDTTARIWRLVEPRLEANRISVSAREGGRARDSTSRQPARSRLSIVGVAAAALLIVSLGFGAVSLENGLKSARATSAFEIAALRARIDSLERGLDTASARIADLKTQISMTTTLTLAAFSPDTHVVRLAGMPAAPKARGTLAMSTNHHMAFMQIEGLPPAPADKIYEAWWIGRRAGRFAPGFRAPAGHGQS